MAAVDKVTYKSNQVVAYRMLEFQARVSGAVRVAPDPQDPAQQQIFISYGPGLVPPKGYAQNLPSDIVYDDTVYPFMMAHWNALMRGDTVKFHFISFEWEPDLYVSVREDRRIRAAQPARRPDPMQPDQHVHRPLYGSRSSLPWKRASPHHILSYIGRTTPRIQKGEAWKYLDAETVFNYPATDGLR